MSQWLRKCKGCGLEALNEEELDLFVQSKDSKYGRANICKPCRQKKVRGNLSGRPEYRKSMWLKKKYNITLEEYDNSMSSSLCCEICEGTEELCYDHDHSKKQNIKAFRGVLCRKCNLALGLLGDTADSLLKAFEYLNNKENK